MLSGKIVEEACYTAGDIPGIQEGCPNTLDEQLGLGSAVPCNNGVDALCWHGTHVAGIAAGNGIYQGVAKDANIIAIQVFTVLLTDAACGGPGTAPCSTAWFTDVVQGLDRVFALRGSYNIASVNLSLGTTTMWYASQCDASYPALKASMDNLKSVGIATIVSSGNEAQTTQIASPACITTAISVGSTDVDSHGNPLNDDDVSGFSNSASFLDLLAPGNQIFSAFPGFPFGFASGTSMAAPHVSGTWALMKQKNSTMTVDYGLSRLKDTGVPILDARNGFTFPRINVFAALNPYPVDPDLASVDDTISAASSLSRTLTDSASVDDSITATVTSFLSVTTDDSASVDDTITATVTSFLSVTTDDSASVDDSITATVTSFLSVTTDDSASVDDTISTTSSLSRTIQDSASVDDTITATVTSFLSVTTDDSASVDDTISAASSLSRTLTDSASVDDTISTTSSLSRTIQDSASVDDTISTASSLSRTIQDSASVDDSITATVTSFLSVTTDDSASVDDTISAVVTTRILRTIADSASISDFISISLSSQPPLPPPPPLPPNEELVTKSGSGATGVGPSASIDSPASGPSGGSSDDGSSKPESKNILEEEESYYNQRTPKIEPDKDESKEPYPTPESDDMKEKETASNISEFIQQIKNIQLIMIISSIVIVIGIFLIRARGILFS